MEKPIKQLISHREPVLAIDRVVRCDKTSATATKIVRRGDYLAEDNAVTTAALIECMAQTVAVVQGARTASEGKPVVGYLVSIDRAEFPRLAKVDRLLHIQVSLTLVLGPFACADGKVVQDGQEVANGSLKFFVPGGPSTLLT